MVFYLIFDLAQVKNYKNFLSKMCHKKSFFSFFLIFHCLQYSEYISIKAKAFRKLFFIKMLRIKSSANAESLTRFEDTFVNHGRILAELPSP